MRRIQGGKNARHDSRGHLCREENAVLKRVAECGAKEAVAHFRPSVKSDEGMHLVATRTMVVYWPISKPLARLNRQSEVIYVG